MSLIETAKKSEIVEISSKVKIYGDLEISSGEELLKSWILILNMGHLYLTFATEKCLLLTLIQNKKIKNQYLNIIGDEELRNELHKIIKDEEIYKFYPTVSAYRLYTEFKDVKEENFKLMINLLKSYIIDVEDEKIKKLKETFKIIRLIAYLSLDSYYSPSIPSININQLLRDPASLGSFINSILMENQELSDTFNILEPLNLYLYQNVYISEEAMKILTIVENYIYRYISNELKEGKSLEEIIKTLICPGQNSIYQKLIKELKEKKLDTVVRLNIYFSPLFDFRITGKVKKELKICSAQKREQDNLDGFVNFWKGFTPTYYVIQYLCEPNSPNKFKVYKRAFMKATEIYEKIENESARSFGFNGEFLNDLCFKNFAKEFITRLIYILSNQNFIYKWKGDGPHAFFGKVKDAKKIINKLKKFKNSELEAKLHFIKKLNGDSYIAISLTELKLKQGKKEFAGFDGLTISLKKDKLLCYILEVKDKQKGGKAEAKKALFKKLKELNVKKLNENNINNLIKTKKVDKGNIWYSYFKLSL
ncbi:MAG: hypothetical protein QW051_03530 [Candidatus Aenigmatarchaeota archaeon]